MDKPARQNIAYLRVSTIAQDIEKNKAEIHHLANGATQRFVARRFHTTEANLHGWMKKRGRKRTAP